MCDGGLKGPMTWRCGSYPGPSPREVPHRAETAAIIRGLKVWSRPAIMPWKDAQHYYEIVRDELRRNIDLGHLPGGTVLFVAAVADRLGVSRPPVRRALELLTRDGVVRRASGRGFVVANGARPEPSKRVNLHALALDI